MKKQDKPTTFINWITSGILHVKSILRKYKECKQLENISIYLNLKHINILLWNEILESQDVKLLDSNNNVNHKYTNYQIQVLSQKFIELYDDYFLKLNNKFAKANLTETQKKIQLSAKIIIITECINALIFIRDNYSKLVNPIQKEKKIYDTINIFSKNVRFGIFNSIDENLSIINKVLVSNESTYTRLYGEDDKKETVTNYTFEKQLVDVEQCLGRTIDVNNTNVYKWIELINLAESISKKRQDGGSKG
jgi:hypothetical protein